MHAWAPLGQRLWQRRLRLLLSISTHRSPTHPPYPTPHPPTPPSRCHFTQRTGWQPPTWVKRLGQRRLHLLKVRLLLLPQPLLRRCRRCCPLDRRGAQEPWARRCRLGCSCCCCAAAATAAATAAASMCRCCCFSGTCSCLWCCCCCCGVGRSRLASCLWSRRASRRRRRRRSWRLGV